MVNILDSDLPTADIQQAYWLQYPQWADFLQSLSEW